MFEWFHIWGKKRVHKQIGPTQIQLKIFNSNKVLRSEERRVGKEC